jgi:hypothetical protein
MGGSDVGSRYNFPFRVIPDRGKISKHSVKPSTKEHWDVLHNHVAGSKLANDSEHLGPESAALSVDSDSLASNGNILAGETACDDINGPEIVLSAIADIPEALRRWEVLRKDFIAKLVNLHLPYDFVIRMGES